MAQKQEPLKPGEATPVSGIYGLVGPYGGQTGESTVSEKGKPLPPTDKPGQGWVLIQPSGR